MKQGFELLGDVLSNLETRLSTVYRLLAEEGCTGPCVHGGCLDKYGDFQECDERECQLDIDSACLPCKISAALRGKYE